ncbi:MAG: TerB family tellurite resistance protein [Bacteroidales bacterium]
MARFGKWVGLGLGWALGGPIGGILGLAVGSIFDSGSQAQSAAGGPGTQARGRTLRGDYAASLIVLIAAVMKADGRVMKSELDYVKRYFVTRFGDDTASEAVVMLRDILKQDIPLRDVTQQLGDRLDYSYRLEMLHFLFGIASADGSVSEAENTVLHRIAGYMKVTDSDFQSIHAMFVSQSDASYKILEVEPTATYDEIKKAYRRMAMKYHPDKVGHLGEDFKKVAHEKFRKVQAAYEQIKKERGIN